MLHDALHLLFSHLNFIITLDQENSNSELIAKCRKKNRQKITQGNWVRYGIIILSIIITLIDNEIGLHSIIIKKVCLMFEG